MVLANRRLASVRMRRQHCGPGNRDRNDIVFVGINDPALFTYHILRVSGRQMELMQWHKETAQQTHQKAQVDTVFEISAQILYFEIQFAQMFVDERDERLLYHGQFVRCTIEQCIEGIAFATHANIIVLRCDLLLEFPRRREEKCMT